MGKDSRLITVGLYPSIQQAMEIKKIWFEDGRLFGLTDDGRTLWQSLLYYRRLQEATEEQRNNYTIGAFGIRWPDIDEDVSFESFEYENPEPTGISKLLLSLPELNLSVLARRLGIQQSLMAAYKSGTKKPSQEREQIIIDEIHKIGSALQSVSI